MNRGDRLVFSNGVIFLSLASIGLLVAFGGLVNALIPLYARSEERSGVQTCALPIWRFLMSCMSVP